MIKLDFICFLFKVLVKVSILFLTPDLSRKGNRHADTRCICVFTYIEDAGREDKHSDNGGGRFNREEQEEEEEGEDTPDVGDSKIAILIVQ